MRNPNRIPKFCNKLAEIWSKYPDFRFGQFMMNALEEMPRDPFFPEDDEMIEYLDNWMKKMVGENNA